MEERPWKSTHGWEAPNHPKAHIELSHTRDDDCKRLSLLMSLQPTSPSNPLNLYGPGALTPDSMGTALNPKPSGDASGLLGLSQANSKSAKARNTSGSYSGELIPQFRKNPTNFDVFLSRQTYANPKKPTIGEWVKLAINPFKAYQQYKQLKVKDASNAGGETTLQRMMMMRRMEKSLDRAGKSYLSDLLKSGVLTNTNGDDAHSTLFYLYSILTTPRTKGLENSNVLKQTLMVLSKPYVISQKFGPLTENIAAEILKTRQSLGLNRAGELPLSKQLRWEDLDVQNSATCVTSSVMYRIAEQQPKEFARHINQLTSPMQAFFEKVKLDEISPEDPSLAYDLLEANNVEYFSSGPNEVTTIVRVPRAGILRAINDSRFTEREIIGQSFRNGIGAAYQSALSFMATRHTYDPATDYRDNLDGAMVIIQSMPTVSDADKEKLLNIFYSESTPGRIIQQVIKAVNESPTISAPNRAEIINALFSQTKGLTEWEKTLVERIAMDNGNITSVTYQVVGGKREPRPEEMGSSFLYGYTRSFEKITADIVQALQNKQFVIIGIVDTDANGQLVGQHEITVTGVHVDKNNELQFVVVDSDDGIAEPVIQSARELIPRIHHIGLPSQQAQAINQEIENQGMNYFVPDNRDGQNFSPIIHLRDPFPWDLYFPPEAIEAALAEANGEAPPQSAAPTNNTPAEKPVEGPPPPSPKKEITPTPKAQAPKPASSEPIMPTPQAQPSTSNGGYYLYPVYSTPTAYYPTAYSYPPSPYNAYGYTPYTQVPYLQPAYPGYYQTPYNQGNNPGGIQGIGTPTWNPGSNSYVYPAITNQNLGMPYRLNNASLNNANGSAA